ncbi:MAG: hypothetical protein JNK29_03740, partial [Anaerolineales bacterium]|nr:hypothetical protein [Anaerolineales bacterium]
MIENLRTGGGPLYLNADGAPFLEQSIDIPTKFPISYAYLRNGQLLVFYRETSRRGGGVSSSAYVWTITPTSIQGAQRRHGTLLTLSALTGRYAAEYARDRQARTPTFGLGPAETRF